VMTGGVEPSHVRGPPDGVEIIPLEEEGATRRVGGRARRGEEDDAGAVVPAGLASASMLWITASSCEPSWREADGKFGFEPRRSPRDHNQQAVGRDPEAMAEADGTCRRPTP